MAVEWEPNHQFVNGETAIISYIAEIDNRMFTIVEVNRGDFEVVSTDDDLLSELGPIRFDSDLKAMEFVEWYSNLINEFTCENVTMIDLHRFPFLLEVMKAVCEEQQIMFVPGDTVAHVWAVAMNGETY